MALELSTQKNAIVVPTKAVQTGQQGDYVYVVTSDNTAEPRPIKTSGVYQNLTLISDGLRPGERVIVDGQLRVAPNAKVTVESALHSSPPIAPAKVAGGAP